MGKLKAVFCILFITLSAFNSSANGAKKFDQEHYSELRKSGKIVEAYGLLKNSDLSQDTQMLAERGMYYFNSPKGLVEKCNAVYDLELALSGGRTWVRPFLDYIYNGAWMAIAAEEGVQQAQRLLGLSLFENLLNKTNPMAAFDKKKAYDKIYKYFNAAIDQKTKFVDDGFVSTLMLAAKEARVEMELEILKPRKLICPVRR